MTPRTKDILLAVATPEPYPDPDPRRPGCWRLPVASRLHRMEAIIDAESLPLVQGKRWWWSPGKSDPTKDGSVILAIEGTPKPPLARIIMGVTDPELLVSHVNGDKLDYRRENLIVRTRSEVALARKPSPETVTRLRPYPDPERPGAWRVPLKGYLEHREVIIDAESLPVVEGRNWNWAERDEGTVDGCVVLAIVGGTQTPLARIIAGVSGTDERVSFANGDPLDCRRQNIVVKSLAEQVHGNRKSAMRAGRPCTSRFKGVHWDKQREKWLAQIRLDGKHRYIGRFDAEIDAAEAYDKAARELFGVHAWLNFPDDQLLKLAA